MPPSPKKITRSFVALNGVLILAYMAIVLGAPRLAAEGLVLIAALWVFYVGLQDLLFGLAGYLALSFYTSSWVFAFDTVYAAAAKDGVFLVLLLARWLRQPADPGTGEGAAKETHRSVQLAWWMLGLSLAIQVVVLMYFQRSWVILLFGIRSDYFYLLFSFAVLSIPPANYERLFRMTLIAAVFPCLVAVVQFAQNEALGGFLPHMTVAASNAEAVFGTELTIESDNLVRAPGTMTGISQFACLVLVMAMAWVTHYYNIGLQAVARGWAPRRFFLEMSVFFLLLVGGVVACGNRTPLIMLLAILMIAGATFLLSPSESAFGRKVGETSSGIIAFFAITGGVLIASGTAGLVYRLVPDISDRYVGSLGYQLGERWYVVKEQFEPFTKLPVANVLLGLGAATQSSAIRHVGGGEDIMLTGLHTESQLLTQLYELGVVGCLLYMVPRLMVAVLAWAADRRLIAAGYPFSAKPLVIAFLVITLFPYANFIIYDPMNAFYWLAFGILCRHVSLGAAADRWKFGPRRS